MKPQPTATCATCGATTEYVLEGKLYRKDRIPSRPGIDERCECGSASKHSRGHGAIATSGSPTVWVPIE